MSKNMVEPQRQQMLIWWRVACWIRKAIHAQAHARTHTPLPTHTHAHTHTHTRQPYTRTQKYIIPIVFPLQQFFHECVSMLHYTHTGCLVLLLHTSTLSYWIVCNALKCVLFHSLILWYYSKGQRLQDEFSKGFHCLLPACSGSYLPLICTTCDMHFGPQWLVEPAREPVFTVFGAVSENTVRWTETVGF